MTRYTQLRERLDSVEQQMAELPVDDTEFDHEAWLVCEWESLRLEIETVRQQESIDGEVDYQ